MPGPKVLVIDDDALMRETTRQVLAQHAFEVQLCPDATTGLQVARSWHPDIVLLDVMLPDSDGFQVLAQLKASPDTHDIPIVFITGYADEMGARRAEAMGAAAYVTKTMRQQDLVRVVEERLAGAEALRALKHSGSAPPGASTQPA